MANRDIPTGFINPQTIHGGPPKLTPYKSDGSAPIYRGDPVKKDGSGRVLSITAASDNPIGVAAHYVAATADAEVLVYDDLTNTTFEAQVDDNTITDDTVIGNFFDITVATGDTTTLLSAMEVDGNASVEDTLVLVGLVNRADNDNTLANNNVRVAFRVDANAVVTATT